MDLWRCGGPQWASVSASVEAASQCHLFFSSVCNFPSTVSKPVVICKWWCFPWDMIVWGNQITPYKSKHRGLAVTVHFILFSVCMAHCVNWHCGLRWCGWCSAAPSVHANVVFAMSCRDVASATTFLIFTCQVPFFDLLWQFTMPLSLAKCHLLGVFFFNKVFLKLCLCMSKARSGPILEKIDTRKAAHHETLHIERY